MAAAKTATPAQILANRRNSQRSTGPKTEEGKARSRANAVKHGLTGAGIALPAENQAAVEALFRQVQDELTPITRVGAELAHDIALYTVRKHRARRCQAARLRIMARHASVQFNQGRADAADRLLDAIESHPRPFLRQLRATPEGVDRLIGALQELLGDLDGPVPAWTQRHHKRLDALYGFKPDDLPWNRPTRFSKAILGDMSAIGDAETADLPEGLPPQIWAMDRMIAEIDATVTRLRAHRATLDLESIEEDRADAIEAALLDTSSDGRHAQRYEAAAARDLSRALRDFHLVEVLGEPESEAALVPPPVAVVEPPTLAPESIPAPPADEPNPNPSNEIDPKLASFGESAPTTAITVPAAAPATPGAMIQGIQAVHLVEPAPHIPTIRR